MLPGRARECSPVAVRINITRALLAAALLSGLYTPPAAYGRPVVWAMPPGRNGGDALRELFTQPDAWVTARSRVDVIGYADHNLDSQYSDAELRAWLPMLSRWGLKLGLEVGAVKPWGPTGAQAFAIETKYWDRFIADGGNIYAIAMDEPLRVSLKVLNKSPEYAVEQTADFIRLVRAKYPAMKVGDIENYPGEETPVLLSFIDGLQARLRQLHVRGLDFVRMDVNWMRFGRRNGGDGWPGVRAIEQACRSRAIPFSLVYWAADLPFKQRQGLATSDTWENSIISQGDDYRAVGGAPDEYVVESWLGTPDHSVPENAPGTFMHSVVDFTDRFVPGGRER